MITSDASPVQFSDRLPEAVDVAVIGGGVIGIATAWFLRQSGVSVLVCDKGRVAGEQSSRNWGWIRQQGRDAAELPIATDGINAWEQIAADLDTDIGFTRQGVLYAAENEAQLAHYESWLRDVATPQQLDSRMLSADEVDERIGDKPGQWRGGLFTPSDGRAEPWKAVPALARGLRARGGLIRENCAVRTIEREAGRVTGLVTEHGSVRTQSIVLAGGAWSTLFLGNLGIRLPQLTVRSTVARTLAAPDIYAGGAVLGEVSIRRRADGGYTVAANGINEHYVGLDSVRFARAYWPALRASTVELRLRFGDDLLDRLFPQRHWQADAQSPFERTRVLNPPPSRVALRDMRNALIDRVPTLGAVPFAQAWAGMIDVLPDVVPVMDEVRGWPGFYLATGFSGHGFGIGPGAGKVMARMVLGDAPQHDLTRFRFARFDDGTPMVPGPGL
ncbi:MAG: FAD-binding oxidoreductase [Pseudomonadota bacterium]